MQLEWFGNDKVGYPTFQSHIGAIRIPLPPRASRKSTPFQSHIGAIRIRFLKKRGRKPLHFNPTLVQLESERYQDYITWNSFQSHIGAIRIENLLDEERSTLEEFQSHIGAIRMRMQPPMLLIQPHFNPTLVQLELKFINFTQHTLTPFQSHIGAIRILHQEWDEN